MYSSNQKKIVIAADALIIVFAFIGRSIAGVMIDAMPDCPFNRFSLRCPSCGGTRAMYHLFQGELKMAFEYNQFFFILTFYLAAVLVLANLAYLINIDVCKRLFAETANYRVIIALAILWLLFGVFRNLVL